MKEQKNKNKKQCTHPQFEKEYYIGYDAEDIICTQCGEVFSRFSKENNLYSKK